MVQMSHMTIPCARKHRKYKRVSKNKETKYETKTKNKEKSAIYYIYTRACVCVVHVCT